MYLTITMGVEVADLDGSPSGLLQRPLLTACRQRFPCSSFYGLKGLDEVVRGLVARFQLGVEIQLVSMYNIEDARQSAAHTCTRHEGEI